MSKKPSRTLTLVHCFLRTYFIGVAFNTRGMQNIGLTYSMQPWLAYLYPDPKICRAATKRYLRHYQCHMLFTPLMLALCIYMEKLIANGKMQPQALESMKSTTAYSLSGLGDALYCSGIIVLWAIVSCGLLVLGQFEAAVIWTLGWQLLIQFFKIITFALALRFGLSFIKVLKRWRLIDSVSWFKAVNSVLIVLLAGLFLTKIGIHVTWDIYIGSLAVIALFGYIIWKTNFARELLLALLAALFWLKTFI